MIRPLLVATSITLLAVIATGCLEDPGQGTTGAGGTTGLAGITGSAGTTAAAGTNGSAGTTGAAGANAIAGTNGSAGTAGPAGTNGTAGTNGSAGTTAAAGTTGNAGRGGGSGNAGRGGTTGAAGTTGNAGRGGTNGGTSGGGTTGTGGGGLPPFSFFVTSVQAMKDLSGNPEGFGGDLRYGETGEGAGLRGADKICAAVAERSMAGSGTGKTWRAFLSTVAGPVHARDRIGSGPWYDRMGRLVASNLTQLIMTRPGDANTAIKNDLPNEYGIPNHTDGAPGCSGNSCPDNHDTLTGTGPMGMLYMNNMNYTCMDWTSSSGTQGMGPWCGHSWPAGSGMNWMSALREGGCAPGINLVEMGPPMPGVYTVGTGGGYGGIYCFALTP